MFLHYLRNVYYQFFILLSSRRFDFFPSWFIFGRFCGIAVLICVMIFYIFFCIKSLNLTFVTVSLHFYLFIFLTGFKIFSLLKPFYFNLWLTCDYIWIKLWCCWSSIAPFSRSELNLLAEASLQHFVLYYHWIFASFLYLFSLPTVSLLFPLLSPSLMEAKRSQSISNCVHLYEALPTTKSVPMLLHTVSSFLPGISSGNSACSHRLSGKVLWELHVFACCVTFAQPFPFIFSHSLSYSTLNFLFNPCCWMIWLMHFSRLPRCLVLSLTSVCITVACLHALFFLTMFHMCEIFVCTVSASHIPVCFHDIWSVLHLFLTMSLSSRLSDVEECQLSECGGEEELGGRDSPLPRSSSTSDITQQLSETLPGIYKRKALFNLLYTLTEYCIRYTLQVPDVFPIICCPILLRLFKV